MARTGEEIGNTLILELNQHNDLRFYKLFTTTYNTHTLPNPV